MCPRSWQSPATRLKFLGVVALLSAGLQLTAVWPDEHHWAKLSPSFAELDGRGEVPWDEIPHRSDYDEYILKYDLWHAKEKFCYDDSTEKTGTARGGYETSYTKQKSICAGVYTTVIKGQDGGESCRGRGKQCEDHFAATSTARVTTCVALIFAAIVALRVLFAYIRARRLGREFEASPKGVFVSAAVLAVGGVVGLAGAYNYRSTAAAADDYDEICDWGCAVSLYGGVGAGVVGLAVAVFEARSNAEELQRWSGIDLKAMIQNLNQKAPSPDAPALKKAFVVIVLVGLFCVGAQAYALQEGLLHWAGFELEFVHDYPGFNGTVFPIELTYDLNGFEISMGGDDPTRGWIKEGISKIDSGNNGLEYCERAILDTCDWTCRGDESFCQDVRKPTIDARKLGWVALALAAVAVLGSGLMLCREQDEVKLRKAFLASSTLLLVGGAVGWTGADNYRSSLETLMKEVGDANQPESCMQGCQLSLSAGVLAIVVGALGIVSALAVRKQRETSAKPSDSVKTPPTPPPDPVPVATRSPAKPTTDPEADKAVERPGFTRKLSSFLFGEQEPVVVEAEAMWEQEELEPEV